MQFDRMLLSTFPAEVELNHRTFDIDVIVLQRGQSKRIILLRIFFISDTNIGCLQQTNHGCKYFLTRQTGLGKVKLDSLSNPEEVLRRPSDGQTCVSPDLRIKRMVPVLLSAPDIIANSLEMGVVGRADPNVLPRRRYD